VAAADRVAICRMPEPAHLPNRPCLNPAVPVIPLPAGVVQVGWTRHQRLSGSAAAAVMACLPLLRQQRRLRGYDDQQREGLALLQRCGALQSGRWPAGWDRNPDSDRARLRGLVNTLATTDAADVVAHRSEHPVWVSAPTGWHALPQALRQLNLTLATSAGAANIAVLVGPTGFQQISSLMRNGTPHLAVSPRTDSVRIGPLVVPGKSACLQCLQLARTERDQHFPLVSLRLENWASVERDPVMTDQAALATARLVSRAIDAAPDGAWGTTNDEEVPDDLAALLGRYWTVTTRDLATPVTRIARHPLCPCWWRPLAAAG
jgi:bacteriocin biosynthesis cyclodehydratase domain-containing protein